MKYIAILGVAFMALVGWMRKYTGTAFLMVVFVLCTGYYKDDVIQYMKDANAREEARQIRLEKKEEDLKKERVRIEAEHEAKVTATLKFEQEKREKIAEDNRKAQVAYERQQKKLQAEEAKSARTQEVLNAWVAAGGTNETKNEVCGGLSITNSTCQEKLIAALVEQATRPQRTEPVKETASCTQVGLVFYTHEYHGRMRFAYKLKVDNGMVKGIEFKNFESFPQIDEWTYNSMFRQAEKYASKINCTGTGVIHYKDVDIRM